MADEDAKSSPPLSIAAHKGVDVASVLEDAVESHADYDSVIVILVRQTGPTSGRFKMSTAGLSYLEALGLLVEAQGQVPDLTDL